MSESRTVLEHLLDSREALVSEVQRLTTAIGELDSVIVRIAGEERRPAPVTLAPATQGAPGESDTTPSDVGVEPAATEAVNPPVEVEPETAPQARPSAKKSAPRKAASAPVRRASPRRVSAPKAPAKRASTRQAPSATSGSPAPKSIRVHVLEMLAAEDRDFGLAEIIDRIHGAGIQAHDDAVRSITIKLMKDGKIERPSRGLYRFAGRRPAAAADDRRATSSPSAPAAEPQTPAPAPADYTPPLNLGQPWDRRS